MCRPLREIASDPPHEEDQISVQDDSNPSVLSPLMAEAMIP
jgi:hypothetical protein